MPILTKAIHGGTCTKVAIYNCEKCGTSVCVDIVKEGNVKGNSGRRYYACTKCKNFQFFNSLLKDDSFYGLSPAVLCELLSRTDLNCGSEKDVLEFLTVYKEKNDEVNELEMAKLLDCVRYGTMEDIHNIHMMKPVDVGTLIVM